MQTLFRVLNLIGGPLLTLVFAAHFAGLTIAGEEAGDKLGGGLAGLIMLAIEIALTQGPKRSRWLRRWLDPRAAFEGAWLQEVNRGQEGNQLAVFTVDYERSSDTFSAQGNSYSADGAQWAKWRSTHMFIDAAHLTATYLWEGELLQNETPEAEKSGLAQLRLRPPPAFSLPTTGDGDVSHLGENTRVMFRLQRVTNGLLEGLGVPFNERKLRIEANHEESQLVAAYEGSRKADGGSLPQSRHAH
jgi:hypothetical protein